MPTIEGGFGLTNTGSARTISVQTESAMQIFDNIAVLETDRFARELGLYGDVVLGRDLKGRFGSFTTPKHLLSNRKNGCTWNPKGGMRMNVEEFPTCPVEFDGEQCPDVFYGTCFERLFGTGNDVRDFSATAEGQEILASMLTKIYQGLGNSFFDLYNYANNPMISTANTEGFYGVSVEEWEDYVDQMLSGECGGIITQLDELAAAGEAYYDMSIPLADVDVAAKKYTGNIIELLEDLKDQASAELQSAMDTGVMMNGVNRMPIILLTPNLFRAYKAWITAQAGTNELAYRYTLERTDGTTMMTANILMYDGMPVIRWDAPARFDAITGSLTFRAAIAMPGVFGVLHDVSDLMQFEGMGLLIEQSTRLADKGKVFMTTNFRWGAGIANKDFVSHASLVLHP
jgi:hypothetical protein